MTHMKKLNKVVVVTGASSGIGLATASYFAQTGCKVYGLSRRGTSDGSFVGVACDVTDYAAVQRVLDDIVADDGRIDVFVNNAGMGISGAVEHIPSQQTENLFRLNTLATMECARLALPYLKQSKGTLVNVSSVAAVVPIPYQTAYSASKAAINMFTQALRLELKGSGVRVCAVMPGDTKTGFTDARQKSADDSGGYERSMNRSVARMERDERKGRDPVTVAKVIVGLVVKRNPPALVAVGAEYKLVCWLVRVLPQRFVLRLVGKLYG